METIKTKVRKWGNSFGIVIPSEVLKQMPLNEGEEVVITIKSNNDISDIFGSLEDWKIDTQKLKDELRKGWK